MSAAESETLLGTRYRYGAHIAPLASGVPLWTAKSAFTGPVALHDHDFLEIELVEAGSALHVSIHGQQEVRTGQVFVLHPGQWHGYERPRGLVLRDVYFDLSLFSRELAWIAGDRRLGILVPQRMPENDRERRAAPQGILSLRGDPAWFRSVVLACDAITHATAGHGSQHRGRLVAQALLLFETLLEHPDCSRLSRPPADHRVSAALADLERAVARPWSLTELAGRCGLSAPHLTRLFRQATGRSPMRYLAHRRAERLAVLLLSGSRTVAQLGAEVGWPNPSYCARQFRRRYGCSPEAFRRRSSTRERDT